MKRTLALAAGLTLGLVLTACGSSQGQTGTTPGATDTGTTAGAAPVGSSSCTLNFLGEARSSTAESQAWQQVFNEFDAKYHCAIKATWQGQYTDVPQNLNEAELSGQKIDLVMASTENYNVAKAGKIMDITNLVKPYASRFDKNALADFTLGGHLFAVPFNLQSSSVFFYNKTVFDKLHLTPPTTFDQLIQVANAIKSKTDMTPIIEGGKDTWEWPMWFMQTFAQTSHNTSIAQTKSILEGKAKFTDPDAVEAFAKLAQFSKDGLLSTASLATSDAGAQADFLQQKSAMLFDGTWSLPVFRAGDPKFDIGVFKFPMMVDTPGVVSQPSGATEGGVSIASDIPKDHLEMAAQFLEFLTRPAPAKTILSTLDAVVPPIKSVPSANDPLAKQLRTEFAPDTILWLDWIWPGDVNNSMINAIQGVLFGKQTPEQAARTVQDQLDKMITQQKFVYDWWNHWTPAQWKAITPSPLPKIDVG